MHEQEVHAVIGMRSAGKTTFLRRLLDERRAAGPGERAVYLSFDDDRLARLELGQLGFLLEEYYRRFPALRRRDRVSFLLDEIQLPRVPAPPGRGADPRAAALDTRGAVAG